MAELNPYAPPPIIENQFPAMATFAVGDGLWQQDKLLVMRIGALLPPKCVKSNVPTERSLKRNLVWYPPWIALTILIAWPIFLVLMLILQKKATIEIGLSPQWISIRKQRMLIAWCIALSAIPLFILGVALVDQFNPAAVLMILAPFLLLGGLIYGTTSARLVYAKKIDDRFIYLKGVCPEFLADLPVWPGTK